MHLFTYDGTSNTPVLFGYFVGSVSTKGLTEYVVD